VKLVAALRADTRGAVNPVSAVVLQVFVSSEFKLESGCTKIALLAVTAVVEITQVAPVAAASQENDPLGAAEQATAEGLTEVPFAAHFVVVASSGVVIFVVKLGEASGAAPVMRLSLP